MTKKLCTMSKSSILNYLDLVYKLLIKVNENPCIKDNDIILELSSINLLNLKDTCRFLKIEQTLEFSHTKYNKLTIGDWFLIFSNLRKILISNLSYNDYGNQLKLKEIFDIIGHKFKIVQPFQQHITEFRDYLIDSIKDFEEKGNMSFHKGVLSLSCNDFESQKRMVRFVTEILKAILRSGQSFLFYYLQITPQELFRHSYKKINKNRNNISTKKKLTINKFLSHEFSFDRVSMKELLVKALFYESKGQLSNLESSVIVSLFKQSTDTIIKQINENDLTFYNPKDMSVEKLNKWYCKLNYIPELSNRFVLINELKDTFDEDCIRHTLGELLRCWTET